MRTVARLGEPASFLSGVSTDAFGERIVRMLTSDGVHLALAGRVSEPTTLAIAQLAVTGVATYRFLLAGSGWR